MVDSYTVVKEIIADIKFQTKEIFHRELVSKGVQASFSGSLKVDILTIA
ncbi:hypothetical protein SAMN05661044_01444 [Olivibacter domesticus]|uniref:Uncharacterized protein n=1 Tax=Olivibacter domesticus TaxID=407022 RepID=A0A1H7KRL7_OLID1|nr:hypothetical protein SAMN05661044_01444 [Olivibacter domesticus]